MLYSFTIMNGGAKTERSTRSSPQGRCGYPCFRFNEKLMGWVFVVYYGL